MEMTWEKGSQTFLPTFQTMSTSSDHEDDFADLFGVSFMQCIVTELRNIINPLKRNRDLTMKK